MTVTVFSVAVGLGTILSVAMLAVGLVLRDDHKRSGGIDGATVRVHTAEIASQWQLHNDIACYRPHGPIWDTQFVVRPVYRREYRRCDGVGASAWSDDYACDGSVDCDGGGA